MSNRRKPRRLNLDVSVEQITEALAYSHAKAPFGAAIVNVRHDDSCAIWKTKDPDKCNCAVTAIISRKALPFSRN